MTENRVLLLSYLRITENRKEPDSFRVAERHRESIRLL